MADYGVGTWDANGKFNNYGIQPITVVGRQSLELLQRTGTYTYTVPSGYVLRFFHTTTIIAALRERRRVVVSGNSIVITDAGNDNVAASTFPALQAELVAYIEKV